MKKLVSGILAIAMVLAISVSPAMAEDKEKSGYDGWKWEGAALDLGAEVYNRAEIHSASLVFGSWANVPYYCEWTKGYLKSYKGGQPTQQWYWYRVGAGEWGPFSRDTEDDTDTVTGRSYAKICGVGCWYRDATATIIASDPPAKLAIEFI